MEISDCRRYAEVIPIFQKKVTDGDAGTRRYGDAEMERREDGETRRFSLCVARFWRNNITIIFSLLSLRLHLHQICNILLSSIAEIV
ncbi:hypothetical protein [Calothrix sp. UHCC 0171]|uniref:hypothetical protein n=1 Tax=Calothrix sp. UHCC 0171 TaxID=3110245 RepID=UPI002B20A6DD|nr:hypothetical protein [Calothrix sp. UHCC 0171]MEA5570822.1 hypothetical protein [Calothrix sp. UHCC 0171]